VLKKSKLELEKEKAQQNNKKRPYSEITPSEDEAGLAELNRQAQRPAKRLKPNDSSS
jgi:hypothetical protein